MLRQTVNKLLFLFDYELYLADVISALDHLASNLSEVEAHDGFTLGLLVVISHESVAFP